jgi:hypothetical protein
VEPGAHSAGRRFAHLVALIGFAIAQPLYQVLAESPTFFVAHRATATDIGLLCAFFLVGAPAGILALESAAGAAWRPFGALLRALATLLLSALFFSLLTRDLWSDGSGALALALAGAGAVLFTFLYETRRGVRDFLALCALAIPVLTGIFLSSAGVRALIAPKEVELTASAAKARLVADEGDTARPPIVMVLFDEFGLTALLDPDTREIDARRFPHLAELAGESTFFRHATAVSPWTSAAVPAILTGRWPYGDERPPIFDNYPDNLFSLLAPFYAMNVHEGLTRLCPDDVCHTPRPGLRERASAMAADLVVVYGHIVLPAALRESLPSIEHQWAGFAPQGEQVSAAESKAATNGDPQGDESEQVDFLAIATSQLKGDRATILDRFLRSLPDATTPTLSFLHVLLPHQPWVYLPSGRRYGAFRNHGAVRGSRWADAPDLIALTYQRYLLQIAFVDAFVGELMAKMRANGTWDEALVIVTADHGANFRPGQSFRPLSDESLDEVMPVPLFVKRPQQAKGELDLRAIQLVDLLPTILDVAGLAGGLALDGRSLLDPDYTGRDVLRAYPGKKSTQPIEVDPGVANAFGFLETQRRLFAGPADQWPFALAAAHDQLVGRGVAEIGTGPELATRAEVDQLGSLQQIEPGSEYLPALVSATVPRIPGLEPPYPVAVSLDGVVRAVTRTLTELGETGQPVFAEPRVLVVLPERVLEPGRHDVALWLIDAPGENAPALLRRIPLAGGPLVWRHTGPEGEALERDEQRWAVRPGAVAGTLDRIQRPDPTGPVILKGWAVDVALGVPVVEVAAFKGDTLLGSSIPSVPREGVAKRYGPSARTAGFSLVVPASALGDYEAKDITVFGLTRTGAAGTLANGAAAAK